MNDVKILLEIKKKIDRGIYDDSYQSDGDTTHTIKPVLIIPTHTLDKIILDALKLKDIDE